MQLQYITEHLHLPEFKVVRCQQIEEENTWLLGVEPVSQVPPCPYCSNPNVIRNGVPYHRTVRHLDSFGQKTYLLVPAIRLFCKSCEANYMWRYESIPQKSRYTKDFQEHLSLTIKRSTVQNGKDCGSLPYSTAERFYKKWLTVNEKKQREKNWDKATHSERLILGIDDFAIRKGHSYNTGIHDLRGESLLDIASGRTYEELCSYSKKNPTFSQLKPYAVVMDLAKSYHRFIKECFPEALRIADRFHVQRHVMECLQQIRKELQQSLPPRLAKQVKKARHVLFKRKETLCPSDIRQLQSIFSLSTLLKQVYEWKEQLIQWYDYALFPFAKQQLVEWCEKGKTITHRCVQLCIRTISNWMDEISNYHRCRFTNAPVEGRNNKIKSIQRRHFFTRNVERYKNQILMECSLDW